MTDQVDNVEETTVKASSAEFSEVEAANDQQAEATMKLRKQLLDLEDRLYDIVAGNMAYYEAIGALLEKYLGEQSRQWRHGWAINTKWLEDGQNALLAEMAEVRKALSA